MKKSVFVLLLLASLLLPCGCSDKMKALNPDVSAAPTLIIDPGHGGEDGGAVAADGSKESELNLAIALKLEALSGFFGVPTVMTRSSETLDYPESADTIRAKKVADQKARLELINSIQNAVFISIHQNLYTSAAPSGAQALYAGTEGSMELAEMMQNNFIALLNEDNKRTASRISDDIYLMKNAGCTAVLIECGFISNPAELELLKDPEYQSKVASIILASYIQFTSGTENSYG